MHKRQAAAFTLIEMLVVVAIIALLISIILPHYKFGAVSKNTVCAANLGNIYTSTVYYTIDNRGYVPPSRGEGGKAPWVGNDWTNINSVRNGSLYTYMGRNESAYICPVFIETPRSWWTVGQTAKPAFTYSLNEYAGNVWQGKPGLRTIKAAEQPEKLHMYGDENPWLVPGYSNHAINNGAMGIGAYGAAGGIVDCLGSYHNPPGGNLHDGFSNVAFYNGAVRLVHVSETKEVVTPYRYKF